MVQCCCSLECYAYIRIFEQIGNFSDLLAVEGKCCPDFFSFLLVFYDGGDGDYDDDNNNNNIIIETKQITVNKFYIYSRENSKCPNANNRCGNCRV